MTNSTLRLLGALSLCLLLAASPALAGAQQSGTSSRPVANLEAPPAGFWTLVWRSVQSLWNKAQPNNGCSLDPYGRCEPGALQQLENGCSIDPYGRCLSGS